MTTNHMVQYHIEEAPFHTYNSLAKYYLLASEICIKERLERRHDVNDTNQGLDNGGILMPAFYLINHALELHIKSFDSICTGESDSVHNMTNAWARVEDSIEAPSTETMTAFENFGKLWNKYQNPKFNGENLFKNCDTQNTTMRYPENALSNINLVLLAQIDSQQILDDIESIRKSVRYIFTFLQTKK